MKLEKFKNCLLKEILFNTCLFIPIFLLFSFICYKQFCINYYDEWTGRGLYPGLAFFHGLDLYEPQNGPHLTLYGWATGLFYFLSGLANNPDQAILIANCTNIFFILIILILLFLPIIRVPKCKEVLVFTSAFFIACMIVFISLADPTTSCAFKIHSDWPAMSFILISALFFRAFIIYNHYIFLALTSFFIALSFWAKLPALPTIFFPVLYFLTEKKLKLILYYAGFSLIIILAGILFVNYSYGLSDTKFILLDHISENKWSDRHSLFDGVGASLISMSYFEAIPLLLRFFSMYLAEYWYLCLSALLCLVFSFSRILNFESKLMLRILSLLYILTLPACLAALAHFGSVENSLFFSNFTGLLCLVTLLSVTLVHSFSLKQSAYILFIITLFVSLPSLRHARSINSYDHISPNQQAYNYLKSGKNDIYFGWYPIAHLLADGSIYTSIEAPTWVGMTKPDLLKFDLSHIPRGAKFIATSSSGYGSTMLEQYIGDLIEVPAPEEVSCWRLFEIKALSTAD